MSRHLFNENHEVAIAPDGMAWECYAAYVDGKWVRGCVDVDKLLAMDKYYVRDLIKSTEDK